MGSSTMGSNLNKIFLSSNSIALRLTSARDIFDYWVSAEHDPLFDALNETELLMTDDECEQNEDSEDAEDETSEKEVAVSMDGSVERNHIEPEL